MMTGPYPLLYKGTVRQPPVVEFIELHATGTLPVVWLKQIGWETDFKGMTIF